MPCDLDTIRAQLCESGIGKVSDELLLLAIIAQLSCESGGGGGGGDVTQAGLLAGSYPILSTALTGNLPALNAALLTALNASNLGSGTVPDARFPATLPAASGINLTALNASNLGSGTVPDARFPATLPAASGINLTALNASNLGSGTVPTARLGSGTADQYRLLTGANTWVRRNLVFANNATLTLTGTTALTTMATFTIPGGAMGPNGFIKFSAFATAGGAVSTRNLFVYLGASAMWGVTLNTGNNYTHAIWANRNNQSSQIGRPGTGTLEYTGSTPTAFSTTAIDTSVDWDLTVRGQSANNGSIITTEMLALEVFYVA